MKRYTLFLAGETKAALTEIATEFGGATITNGRGIWKDTETGQVFDEATQVIDVLTPDETSAKILAWFDEALTRLTTEKAYALASESYTGIRNLTR